MASYNYTFQSGDGVTPTRLNDARTVSDIVNADIKSDAAIAGTKIAPDFGAQNVVTTGSFGAGTATPTSTFGKAIHLYNAANTGDVASNSYLLVQSVNRNANIELNGGSSSTNSISFSSTVGTTVAGIACGVASSNLIFRTGGTTERMRIDASGNVGIGTNSPAAALAVSTGDSRKQFTVDTSADPVVKIGLPDWYSVGALAFVNGSGGERMRIKATGQVRFYPLASDPAGAEAGDVYYNSGDNKLKVYNGSSWVNLH